MCKKISSLCEYYNEYNTLQGQDISVKKKLQNSKTIGFIFEERKFEDLCEHGLNKIIPILSQAEIVNNLCAFRNKNKIQICICKHSCSIHCSLKLNEKRDRETGNLQYKFAKTKWKNPERTTSINMN